MNDLKTVHTIRYWRQYGKLYYKCEHCKFLRTIDITTGEIETVNHGDKTVIHSSDEVHFEYTEQPLQPETAAT